MSPLFQVDLSSRVDVGADKGLSQDREEAALGLLALSSAGGNESVDRGRGGWCY